MSRKSPASAVAPGVTLGGKSLAEGPQRLPAVSYVVAGSGFFLMC